MTDHQVVSQGEWVEARKALLAKEKAFTQARDALSKERRALPWVKVEKDYRFQTADGERSLSELFGDRSQLLVQHFMFGPDWEAPCKSCAFWADNFNGITPHLDARDVSFVVVSRAPLAKLQATAKRLGWSFPWVSSEGSDFNYDLGVSFTPEALAGDGAEYNFRAQKIYSDEMPGISAFYRDEDGAIYRTYSCYARGLDMLNGAYHYLDLMPKGRDEDALDFTMSWLRLNDEYDA